HRRNRGVNQLPQPRNTRLNNLGALGKGILVVRIQRLVPASDGGDNGIWIGGPGERLRLGIVLAQEAFDGGLEVDDRVEYPAFEPALRELGEEALDGVEPGAGCWHEMEGPARMAVEPGPDLRVLVRGVVVEDGMNALVRRNGGLDGIEEADELLMPVALHVSAD